MKRTKTSLLSKSLIATLLILTFFTFKIGAVTPPDEGMWLPIFVERLNYVDMQKMGLKLTAEEIYSINNSSIKDAIVGLSNSNTPSGFFCSAEVVSEQGLIFTNHHCGFSRIQSHSTIEHDYLKDGFWAMSKDEELTNEGLTATFFVRMEDVTDSIVPFLSDTMSESDRSSKVRKISKRLKKAAGEKGKYHTVVKGFFGGTEYYLFVYEVYRDVRLVGAPPSEIGKYGGDTDNWMWPRHTGDFSIFRIYCAPDGSPANYSEENVPLTPKYHLPISLDGVEKDDFAMIWGYPGGTNRYMTSYGVEYQLDYFNPVVIKVLGAKLDVWREDMDTDREIAIQYASKYSGLSNFWKYSIGQSKGLKALDVFGEKEALEEKFQDWADANPDRKEKYGNVLGELKTGYAGCGPVFDPLAYTLFAGSQASEAMELSLEFGALHGYLEEKTDKSVIEETVGELRDGLPDHFKDYNVSTDKKAFVVMLKMYSENVPSDIQPDYFKDMVKKYKGDFEAYADYFFDKSIFVNEARLNAFLDNPKLKQLDKDPAYQLATAMRGGLVKNMGAYRGAQTKLGKNKRLFMAGLREMYPDKVYYPDANSTMRLTYGSVEDYYPADAVHFDYITHLSGVMDKEDPSSNEFTLPDRLKKLYAEKDFGPYGKDGKMIVCFLTTNDITGGNSGSPVINGNGELIGIAFDGNWEAMSGDIAYEKDLQRTINVDIRYVLFVIDKYAGAQNLIDELTIVHKIRDKAAIQEERIHAEIEIK